MRPLSIVYAQVNGSDLREIWMNLAHSVSLALAESLAVTIR